MVVWLFTGGKKYFFMEKYYLQEFLSFEREFWELFSGNHLLAHSVLDTVSCLLPTIKNAK